ncbi:MAG: propionate catabolism operon regulatory protein PrpR [Pseudomonadota bacterium]
MREFDAHRRPRIWVMSYSRLSRLVESMMPDYQQRADIRIASRRFEEALDTARELIDAGEVDVFVSAGANGAFLRRYLDFPVVIIKVGGFDIMRALVQAAKVSTRVAIVTHEEISPELEQFTRLFNLDIELRRYTSLADAREQVEQLAARGVKVVVGPSLISDLADERGLTGVFLYSRDAVREALDDAIELARLARIEEARRERLNIILRHLHEGVVAVDLEERVQSINPAMEQLVGVAADQALGRPWSEIAPHLSLAHTLKEGAAEMGVIERIGSRTVVANRIPISEQGAPAGAVLTFQDAAAIQRADRNLRAQDRPRQFVAKYRLSQLLGDSAPMRRARALAEKYAATDATVLITGESGTGKELLAQGIHNASRRRRHPFVAINCAAFPEALLESELFGYEEGAFTGSRRGGKAGLIESAHTGTLFLDEIGEMPIALQTRLLRVLQEREVLRLGSTEPTPVDVRVIAATNRKLRERVAAGQFREDLYFRLNILRIELPPLRERPGDIPLMATQLLSGAIARMGGGRDPGPLAAVLIPYLAAYAWPGNVREMENIIERIAVFWGDTNAALPEPAQLRQIVPELFADAAPEPAPEAVPLRSVNRRSELEHIRRVLEECNGNQAAACKRLGIGRTTLWRKLKRLESA